eukprot:TRINITY_DN5768_c0_g1_i1.p1 TRINITY_DN5768_c0_g1~~TRINITY_DN5768_c0_g1_i1.p1  ORF type:complete len:356 (+),score=65.76 TRINITY_DN5768_c0_g1_i1:148-1215(+)
MGGTFSNTDRSDCITEYDLLLRKRGQVEEIDALCEKINCRSLGDLVENMNDAIMLVIGSSIITGFNRAAEEMLGYNKRDVIGCPLSIVFYSDRFLSFCDYHHIAVKKKGGGMIYVSISVTCMSQERHLVTLRVGNPRVHQIITSMNDAVVLSDRYGIIIGMNTAAELLFEFSEKELLGQTVDILIWDEGTKRLHSTYLSNYHKTGNKQLIGQRRAVYGKSKAGQKLQVEILLSEMEEKQILACFRTIRDKAQQEYELQIGISSTSESQFFIKSSIIHFIFPTCAAGDVEGLRVLLERIGCVDETDHAGQTALHHAVLGTVSSNENRNRMGREDEDKRESDEVRSISDLKKTKQGH